MSNAKVIKDMPHGDYLKAEGISNSLLSRMKPTPANCKEHMDNPSEATPDMLFGRYLHSLVLEPETVADTYAIKPECDRRTKVGKAIYAEFIEKSEGKPIVTLEQVEAGTAMQSRLNQSNAATTILEGCEREVSVFWQDGTGAAMKCRFDAIGKGLIVDYKTCADASPAGFPKSIATFGYHRQAALYTDGYEAAFGERPKGFVFIAQEKKAPYLTACYVLDGDSYSIGYDEYRRLLVQFLDCQADGVWSGYPDQVEEVSLPNWYS